MSDFDDAIGDAVSDMLAEAGSDFSYIRDGESTTVTLRKANQPSAFIEVDGVQIELISTDFIGLAAELPYSIPRKGDRITDGTTTWEVQPTVSEKPYRMLADQIIRIHARQQ